MADPKLKRIIDAVAARAATILIANGSYADLGLNVVRDSREPNAVEDLPALLVYLGQRTTTDTTNKRAKCDQTITVAGYRALNDGDESETIGIEILSDIQTAIEAGDETLGNLLQGTQYGMTFQGDSIFMPDSGEGVVGAQVVYSIPHIRRSGDPEIS